MKPTINTIKGWADRMSAAGWTLRLDEIPDGFQWFWRSPHSSFLTTGATSARTKAVALAFALEQGVGLVGPGMPFSVNATVP